MADLPPRGFTGKLVTVRPGPRGQVLVAAARPGAALSLTGAEWDELAVPAAGTAARRRAMTVPAGALKAAAAACPFVNRDALRRALDAAAPHIAAARRERTIQMLEAAAPRFAAYPAALRKAVALLREGDTPMTTTPGIAVVLRNLTKIVFEATSWHVDDGGYLTIGDGATLAAQFPPSAWEGVFHVSAQEGDTP